MSAPKQDAKADQWSGLEALAKAATAGPWDVYGERIDGDRVKAVTEAMSQVNQTEDVASHFWLLNAGGKCPALTGCGPTSEANAAFIAKANPSQVLELIAAARASTVGMEAKPECTKPSPKGCDVELREAVKGVIAEHFSNTCGRFCERESSEADHEVDCLSATDSILALINQARQPEGGGEAYPCQSCAGSTRAWSAPNELWNRVVGGEGGFLCPNCFIDKAEAQGLRHVWSVAPTDNADGLSDDRAVDKAETPPAGKDLAGEVERLRADDCSRFVFVEALARETYAQKHGPSAWKQANDAARRQWIDRTQDAIRRARQALAALGEGERCKVPPPGWFCTRKPGHEGPCAAWPDHMKPEVIGNG